VYRVDFYELVRRGALVEGKSDAQIARDLGIDRRTVKKLVENPVPPGYRMRQVRAKPKLGAFMDRIEEILRTDETAPRKQRHHARRIFERLRDEEGYTGGESQVRAYVAQVKGRRQKEAYVPLVSSPGEAEVDFFEAWVRMAGVPRKVHCFLIVLPFSGAWFCAAYPAENAESFADGHVRAFRFFGGVPRRCVYDNPAYAVNRGKGPLRGRSRDLAQMFGEIRSTFLFEAVFAAPAKGNEKGSVESKVKTVRSSCMVPVPNVSGFKELNEMLAAKAGAVKEKADRFAEDAALFLPAADYEASRLTQAKVDKTSLVQFEACSYSVPCGLVGRTLLLRATPFHIEVLDERQVVARHERSLEKGRLVTEISHYIDVLERKPRAARSALPVLQAGLPAEFEAYRQRVEDGTGEGDRRFVAVLRLAGELGVEIVAAALGSARERGAREPADIRLLAMSQVEGLPGVCKSGSLRPGLKAPSVERPTLSDYTGLLAGGAR
jgi:transposase